MEKRRLPKKENQRPDSADCTKLRIVFAAPLAVDLLLLAVAAALLIGGAA